MRLAAQHDEGKKCEPTPKSREYWIEASLWFSGQLIKGRGQLDDPEVVGLVVAVGWGAVWMEGYWNQN